MMTAGRSQIEETEAVIDDARLVREDAEREAQARRIRGDSTGLHQGLDLRHEAHCDDEGGPPPPVRHHRGCGVRYPCRCAE